MVIQIFILNLFILLLFQINLYFSYGKENEKSYVVPLDAYNLTENFEDWNKDIALMFYSPWCKYCK